MPGSPAVLLLAVAIDALIGDPAPVYRRLSHPVTLIGRLVETLDDRLNRETAGPARRRAAGAAAALLLLALSFGLGWLVQAALRRFGGGWIAEALLISIFLAQRSLHDHVAEVARALGAEGLAGGRQAVARIVGRDPESLDEAGVSRAALESLAENLSDGVTAPLFWGLLLGFPGVLAYKAVNTADSMIGHRTPRHLAFGWAAARLDDLLNLIPARLAALILAAAALVLPGCSVKGALRAMRSDAARHRSPNAGWPEAAMAGALGLALAGPRRYGGEVVKDHWMNAGARTSADAGDIRRGLRLFIAACLLQAAILALIALL